MIATLFALLAIITAPYAPVSYSCNGVTAAFAVTFPYQDLNHVVAISTTGAGVATTLSYTTDYTLSVVSTLGTATLTLTNPAVKCPTGSTLKISRVVPLTQPTNFAAQLSFRPELHTAVADLLEMQIQQVNALSPPSLLTTKGDLLGRNANSPVRVPVGTTSQVLMADPTSAAGLSWVAPTVPAETSQPGLGSKAPFINVRADPYYAKGDGVADEVSAVQAAITAGAGKTIRFPSGTYKFSASLTAVSGTDLICDGFCTIQPYGAYAGNLFEISGVAGFHVRGGFSFSGFNQLFHATSGSSDILIQGVTVTGAVGNPSGAGIGDFGNSSNVRILDNYVSGTDGMGIDIEDCNGDIIVSRNVIVNVGHTSLGGEGIAIRALVIPFNHNDMIVVSDNIIEDAGKAGIKVVVEALYNGSAGSFAGSQVQRVSITGNTIHGWGSNVAGSGIDLHNLLNDGSQNQAFTITGNVIESKNRITPAGCPGACTFPWELSYIQTQNLADSTISGNIGRGGVTWSGIVLQGSKRTTVTGNVVSQAMQNFTGTGGSGGAGAIALLSLSDYNTVTGNTIRNPGKSGDQRPGIYVEQSRFNTISSNVTADDQGTPATGTLTLSGVIAADTAAVNGTTFTASGSLNTGTSFLVGATDTDTATNLAAALTRTTGTRTRASSSTTVVTVTAQDNGTEGNAITLVGSARITASAGTLAGGTYTPTMSNGIEASSAGPNSNKNDFNVFSGNVSHGHATAGMSFTLQQHQIAFGNQDGASGGITFAGTAAAARSGVRNASTRNILRNASVAPVDCGGAGITATVTQMLDGGIFTCGTAQNLTMARADTSSGMVQALPGIPAVGDIFQFVMSSTAAANFTLVAGLNITLVGNAVINNSSRLVVCRITAVTLNAETATCYL